MDEIQQAVFNNAGCTQHLPLGQEDCLSLSIYTPSVSETTHSKPKIIVTQQFFWEIS
jgi:hypothetical protein